MSSWHSYPSIYALGHKAIQDLFNESVLIQEKIDGSQISFGIFDGEYRMRSKGKEQVFDAPDKMFTKAAEVIKTLPLREGYTYRAEYLQKPKHNALAYDRVPEKHLIIFDINVDHESYMPWWAVEEEAARIGLETVPLLYQGSYDGGPEGFLKLIDQVSVLGGQKMEGVVIKNYLRFGPDKKVLMGKFVSEAFKEVHRKEWGESNPGQGDIIQRIVAQHKTPARWNKAIQHLRERGELDESPKDIGNLIKEVHADVLKECEDDIKQQLYNYAKQHILRGVTAGLPEWYKEELMKRQFAGVEV